MNCRIVVNKRCFEQVKRGGYIIEQDIALVFRVQIW